MAIMTKDKMAAIVMTFLSCKILSVTIKPFCSVKAYVKPLNIFICYSIWTSWIIPNNMPPATQPPWLF